MLIVGQPWVNTKNALIIGYTVCTYMMDSKRPNIGLRINYTSTFMMESKGPNMRLRIGCTKARGENFGFVFV